MACKKVPQQPPLRKLPEGQKGPPDRDACLYIDQAQYQQLDAYCGAIEGIAAAMRPHDEVAGLAEALQLAWDRITDILGEVERQNVACFFGGSN
jgi:hypothetical protein